MRHSKPSRNVDSFNKSNSQTSQPRHTTARLTNGFKFVATTSSITECNSREDDDGNEFLPDTTHPRNLESFNARNCLYEQYNSLKLREMQLAGKINSLKSEILYLRKMMVKTENDVRLKTAKVDRDRDQAIELLVDLLEKKVISFDKVPTWSYVTSESSLIQKNLSRKSRSADDEKKNHSMDAAFLNALLKNALKKVRKVDSAALKTLSRSYIDRRDTSQA